MAGTKTKMIFDPADLTDSDNVGAYIRAGSDGELIDSTSNALHVLFTNTTIAVTATDLDIRDLTHVSDSVKIGDGTETANVTASNELNVIESNLTLLRKAEDAVHSSGDSGIMTLGVRNDAGTALAADGDYIPLSMTSTGAVRVSASFTSNYEYAEDSAHSSTNVGAFVLAVQTATQGAIAGNGDYTAFQLDPQGRLRVNDAPNGSIVTSVVSVGTSEVAVPTSALATRKRILFQNVSANPMYIGPTGVTTSGATLGYKIEKGGELELEAGPLVAFFAISGSAAMNLHITELG